MSIFFFSATVAVSTGSWLIVLNVLALKLSVLIVFLYLNKFGLVWFWFLCLMAYQLFLGYLMPKPFS